MLKGIVVPKLTYPKDNLPLFLNKFTLFDQLKHLIYQIIKYNF